jgi:hypothetical protein
MRTAANILKDTLLQRAQSPLVIEIDPSLDVSNLTPGPDAVPWTTEDGETHAICEKYNDLPQVLLPRIGIIRVTDDSGKMVGTVNHPAKIPVLEEVYYRFALPMILQSAGAEMIHASAVRVESGVVAFCGTSGTGKSTLSYSLARRNHPHWADDAVVFLPGDAAFEALRLPFRPRVEVALPEQLNLISGVELAPLAAIVVLQRHAGGLVDSAVFHAEVRRLSAAEAFRAVLPHIYSFILSDPRRNALMMSRYFDIAARLPVYDVRFTPCLDALSKLCEIIEGACFARH